MQIPVDVSSDELFVTPIAPDGTEVVLQITEEPKLSVSENPKYHEYTTDKKKPYILNFMLEVVECADVRFKGSTIFHTLCVPGEVFKKALEPKGWSAVRDGYVSFMTALGQGNGAKVQTDRLVGKKLRAILTVEEYQGRSSNRIKTVLSDK